MTVSANNKVKLPTWLREVVDDGEPTDSLLNKRAESRNVAHLLVAAMLAPCYLHLASKRAHPEMMREIQP